MRTLSQRKQSGKNMIRQHIAGHPVENLRYKNTGTLHHYEYLSPDLKLATCFLFDGKRVEFLGEFHINPEER